MDRSARQRVSNEVDWVDLGELSTADPALDVVGDESLQRVSNRTLLIVGLVVAAVILGLVVRGAGTDSGSSGSLRATPSVSVPPPGLVADTPDPAATLSDEDAQPIVVPIQRHLLGIQAGWNLFGWGSSEVVRVEPAAGRLTVTRVPEIGSTGPVWFVVGPGEAVVRPLDDVPGYRVPDGEIAAPLTGALAGGGVAAPGPKPGYVWRETDDPLPSVVLTRLDGIETGTRAGIPGPSAGPLISDGSGYLFYIGTTGVFDVRPAGLDLVTPGTVLASGGNRVLTVECNDEVRCQTAVLNRTDGSRRVIGPGLPAPAGIGSISPDGRWAAVKAASDVGASLQLVDLATGRTTRVPLDGGLETSTASGSLAWSPDSRMLFALDGGGQVQEVDPATGSVHDLGVRLPDLEQIAVRPAP